jgi:hypothetical protein
MKTATKEQEIQALKALVEMNGYFAEAFGGDLEAMCQNISNDFPIEMGTRNENAIEYLEKRNNETEKAFAKEKVAICDKILCLCEKIPDKRLYEIALNMVGQTQLIARKHELSLPLKDHEVEYLLALASAAENKQKEDSL